MKEKVDMSRCFTCERQPVTHICKGGSITLPLCLACSRAHAQSCPDILSGEATLVEVPVSV